MALRMGSSVLNPALSLLDYPDSGYPSNRRSSWFLASSLFNGCPAVCPSTYKSNSGVLSRKACSGLNARSKSFNVARSTGSSSSAESPENSKSSDQEVPFGYSRKDVLLIGLGLTVFGVGLKSGLEFFGVDSLQSGNVVQLVMVLGLTVGWIASYIFRVSNKDMTYAQQLRDYENKVMQKRLEGLTEAELEALLEQVEEEKSRLSSGEQL